MADWQLIASDGFRGEVGGDGLVFGTNGFQDIHVLSRPGSVVFDPSFNKGDTVIRLDGDADSWQISRFGSSAVLSDGETSLSIPVGSAGLALVFADGARTLRFADSAMVVGDQVVTAAEAPLSSAAEDGPLPDGADQAAVGRLILEAGADLAAGGNLEVFGTSDAELLEMTYGRLVLDPSFNKGGDSLSFAGVAADYGAARSGSSVVIEGADLSVVVPFGTEGTTLSFADGERALAYETIVETVLFGTQTIGAAPTTLEAAAGDVAEQVLFWNAAALDAISETRTIPAAATRALAIQSIAVNDAIASITHQDGFWIDVKTGASADLASAVAYASYVTLVDLFPGQAETLAARLEEAMPSLGTGSSFAQGKVIGTAIAEAVLAIRTIDGYDGTGAYEPHSDPGYWSPADPALPEAPQWASLQTFLLQAPDQFRAPPPPALDSKEYADALNAVKGIGAIDSTVRTDEQTETALFWRDGLGTYTPPGHWNAIAEVVAQMTGGSTAQNAHTFAMLNVALADAAVAAWDTKYSYDLWRPSVAIHNADQDGNELTEADPDWTPLFANPSHPDYVSGHSTFSGAGAAVLTALFGEDFAFSIGSAGLDGVVRDYDSFAEAAKEAGISRIYGGIHTSYANEEGYNLGTAVGMWTVDHFAMG